MKASRRSQLKSTTIPSLSMGAYHMAQKYVLLTNILCRDESEKWAKNVWEFVLSIGMNAKFISGVETL